MSRRALRRSIAATCIALVAGCQVQQPSDDDQESTGFSGAGTSAPPITTPSSAGAGAGGNSGAGGSGGASVGSAGATAGTGGVGGAAGAAAGAGGAAAGTGGMAGASGVGGAAGAAGAAAGAGGAPSIGTLPPVMAVDMDGPFMVTQSLASGPGGDDGLWHPTELGKDGIKHPIFLWSCGGGSNPTAYVDHMSRIASHGFVVTAMVSTGNGGEQIASLEWLTAENARMGSPLFGKLDLDKVGAGGHSLGSVSTFAIGDDPRIDTTIHVAGGSFDGNGHAGLHAPTAYVCGEADTLATPQCVTDYANTDNVPVFYTLMDGVNHIQAAREGLPVMVAWLRWHLGGEEMRRGMFLDPSCEFCMGKWVSQSKNW